jgi:predicted O-methyltransferase YrrM
MKWWKVHEVVESMRLETSLYLPAISNKRGFSSSRIEHMLDRLVAELPNEECYLEVGTLEGRTLQAASITNTGKKIFGCDPGDKYHSNPGVLPGHVEFFNESWEDTLIRLKYPIGLVFYDADHSAVETRRFMDFVVPHLANEAVLILDDWDRESVRRGAFESPDWRLLREMPEYTDGLTCPPNHFGYYFGVALFGYRENV